MTKTDDAAELKPAPRAHLVERAAAAMGSLVGFDVPAPAHRAAATPRPQVLQRSGPEPAGTGQLADAGGEQASAAAGAPTAEPVVPLAEPPLPTTPDAQVVPLETLTKAGLSIAPITGRNRVSEEIGVVQHQVLRNLVEPKLTDSRGRIVLVTSARPGEGKSFTALNIAAALAFGGKSVVLVDADAKHGAIGEQLGLREQPGLRLLAEDPDHMAPDLLVRTAVPRLLLLPYGRRGPNSGSLPAPAKLAATVLRLADSLPDSCFVVDATPCLSTSDPGALAAAAGQVLLVVEAERTQRNEIEAALDMVDVCPLLQLVLNKVTLSSNETFGAYYGAYYDG